MARGWEECETPWGEERGDFKWRQFPRSKRARLSQQEMNYAEERDGSDERDGESFASESFDVRCFHV